MALCTGKSVFVGVWCRRGEARIRQRAARGTSSKIVVVVDHKDEIGDAISLLVVGPLAWGDVRRMWDNDDGAWRVFIYRQVCSVRAWMSASVVFVVA